MAVFVVLVSFVLGFGEYCCEAGGRIGLRLRLGLRLRFDGI